LSEHSERYPRGNTNRVFSAHASGVRESRDTPLPGVERFALTPGYLPSTPPGCEFKPLLQLNRLRVSGEYAVEQKLEGAVRLRAEENLGAVEYEPAFAYRRLSGLSESNHATDRTPALFASSSRRNEGLRSKKKSARSGRPKAMGFSESRRA
jgi:hypothetical protein